MQTFAAVCAGATSGLLTTPLDVVKTRLQTAPFEPGKPKPTFRSVAAQLLRDEGAAGFMRGVVPRISSAMVRPLMRCGRCVLSRTELRACGGSCGARVW